MTPANTTTETALLNAYCDVMRQTKAGFAPQPALGRFASLRMACSPEMLLRVDSLFRRWEPYPKPERPGQFGWFAKPRTAEQHLADNPGMAAVFVHASSGFLRQAAVKVLQHPETDPLAFTALLLRCNDWVAEVRAAALARLTALVQLPRLDVLPPLLPILMRQSLTWQRGGAEVVRKLATRPDWRLHLERMFLEQTSGPLARLLRQSMQTPVMDSALPALALSARSSFVRATAAEALLLGRARWPEGRERQWIDKSMGRWRPVTRWGQRDLTVEPGLKARVLQVAAQDKSTSLRKLAADHLVAAGPEGNAALVARLSADKSAAVRMRMAYFASKWHKNEDEGKTND